MSSMQALDPSSDEGGGRTAELAQETEGKEVLRQIVLELQIHLAESLAEKEAALQEASDAQEVASKAQRVTKTLQADLAALHVAKAKGEVELEERVQSMTADLHSMADNLANAEDQLQNGCARLEGARVNAEELVSRISALQDESQIAQARILNANVQRDAAQESVALTKQALDAAQRDVDEGRLQREAAQTDCDRVHADLADLRNDCEATKAALLHAKTAAEAARADTGDARTRQQAAEVAEQVAAADKDRLHQRMQAMVQECMCPIRHSMFDEPVLVVDGHCYERQAIERWFIDNDTSPLTGLRLQSRAVLPNRTLAKLIGLLRSDDGDAGSEGSGNSSANPQEESPVAPGELWRAARSGNRTACLDMLRRGVPDINYQSLEPVLMQFHSPLHDRHQYEYVQLTVLHLAAVQGWADVCTAIFSASGFTHALALARNVSHTDCLVSVSAREIGYGKGLDVEDVLRHAGEAGALVPIQVRKFEYSLVDS